MVKVSINAIRIVKYNGLWCTYLAFWILVIYDIIWTCIIYGGLGISLMIKWYHQWSGLTNAIYIISGYCIIRSCYRPYDGWKWSPFSSLKFGVVFFFHYSKYDRPVN